MSGHGWGHQHTAGSIELSAAAALLVYQLLVNLLRAHTDVPVDRHTRDAIGDLRHQLHKAGKAT